MTELAEAAAWHRRAAAFAAAADRAGVDDPDVAEVRARLLAQQLQFSETAGKWGQEAPGLVPSSDDISAATASLGDLSADAVAGAVRTAMSTLDSVDRVIGSRAPAPARPRVTATGTPRDPEGVRGGVEGLPVTMRNALIYGTYAFIVLFFQVFLLVRVSGTWAYVLTSPLCLIVLPLFGWAAGWVTIGAIFKEKGRGARSARLGLYICLSADLMLCVAAVFKSFWG
jgi:hypothetical protein